MSKPEFKAIPSSAPLDTPGDDSERGVGAMNYLLAHGISAISPPIRSSDVSRGKEDPFYYYLTSRLGIAKNNIRKIGALDTGSFFHTWMQAIRTPNPDPIAARMLEADSFVQAEVDSRYQEAEGQADERGMLPGGMTLGDYMDDLQKEAELAISMGRLSEELMPLKSKAYQQMEVLHVEKLLAANLPEALEKHPVVGRIDTILADHERRECWIEDHKSTSFDPRLRAMTASYEFPVRLYRLLVDANKEELKLPYKVVGFRHNILQKPTIRIKKNENREEYMERYRQWLTATGEYSHLEAERRAKNSYPYLTSMVRFMEPLYSHEFVVDLQYGVSLATRMPFPDNFPRGSCINKYGGSLNDLHPFYLYPPKQWPSIIESGDFVIGRFRDWETVKEIL